ncbi:MAG: murein biosynthesis integral membrane protein MurJ [Heliobacteriaceae bacterium]|jgi:putative peptidoglycan lipid II flippase|nr:murein biosynthesis integral membrane protein MurJ [Heliobacteriaceae bacterium]
MINKSDNFEDGKTTGILRAATLIAAVTIFSKLIGFIRDVIIANYYGASTVSDAYFYAYQIPSLALILLGGVGGPFHSAAVSVFSKLIPNLNEKPSELVNKLYNTFLTGTIIFFTALGVLFFTFSDQIMQLIISEGSPVLISLAAKHLEIMSPIFVIGGIAGIYYGILVTYKHFMLPNISPVILSLVIILMVVLAKNDPTGVVLAWATTIGAICQLVLQYPKIRQIGFKFKPDFHFFNNPEYKNICELLFPAVLSSTVGQLHIYVDMFFASSIREGAWTAIGYANRVFQFPVGILVTAFLVPLFPLFSRLVAKEDYNGIREYFNKGVGTLFLIGIPIIIGILAVGYDCISLIFKRGAFDNDAVFMVTEALWFLSVSILPYVFRDSVTRVYYSFNDSKTPFIIAFSSILLKLALNFVFIKKMGLGIGGVTLSTSLVTLFNACLLGVLISKRITLKYKELFKNLAKMLAAGAVSLAVCFAAAAGFDLYHPEPVSEPLWLILKISCVSIILLTVYVGLNLLFRTEYALAFKERLRR